MSTTPLLDGWQPPQGAGKPVAVFATTFVLDPTFFEADCLGRFLSLTNQDEGAGSSLDLLAQLEREDALGEPQVTVLADRSTAAERTSLRWDLLHCTVKNALLHSKVAILMWENATRVLIGSANLTPAGYRRQIEIGITADLDPHCLLPPQVLRELADELDSYLDLIPGADRAISPVTRSRAALAEFRSRVRNLETTARPPSAVKVALAPTNLDDSPLARWEQVWQGPKPLRASQMSPFWDADDTALKEIAAQLTGLPKSSRGHSAATVPGYDGAFPLPPYLAGAIDTYRLKQSDDEARPLHAKCLLLSSDTWIAALVGSSNHTRAGLGLIPSPHRELNVWLGASLKSREGKALAKLIPTAERISVGDHEPAFDDEDEQPQLSLPLFFEFCQLRKSEMGDGWQLDLHFNPVSPLDGWCVATTSDTELLSSAQWLDAGRPASITRDLPPGEVPSFITVRWSDGAVSWTVLVDDPHLLPPGPAVADLTARQLFAALATGKSITSAAEDHLRDLLAAEVTGVGRLDPLLRHDDPRSLMREGRALSAALLNMQRRLAYPAPTVDAVKARLAGPLGPGALAAKVVESIAAHEESEAGGLFKLAELAMAVGRADWASCLARLDSHDASLARTALGESVDEIARRILDLVAGPHDITEYARRAVKEARACLGN